MQVTGIGIDIVEVARMREAIQKWGERFLKRVFTATEIEYCSKHINKGIHFSARFAAKEAVKKAIGKNIKWTDVEVVNEGNGKPIVKLGENIGLSRILLSISHTDEYAIAHVVIQAKDSVS